MKHLNRSLISEEKQLALEARLAELGIEEKDLVEKFIRAQGRGGQKVNKSSSCVYLKHVPSGIEVKCQETRSQVMNRFFARRLLAERFAAQAGRPEAQFKAERIRRQKQRRRRRTSSRPVK